MSNAAGSTTRPTILDKMPKRLQPHAKVMLHEIWMADTRENANKAFHQFAATYEATYLRAVECLTKDRDVLLTIRESSTFQLRSTTDSGLCS